MFFMGMIVGCKKGKVGLTNFNIKEGMLKDQDINNFCLISSLWNRRSIADTNRISELIGLFRIESLVLYWKYSIQQKNHSFCVCVCMCVCGYVCVCVCTVCVFYILEFKAFNRNLTRNICIQTASNQFYQSHFLWNKNWANLGFQNCRQNFQTYVL